MGWDRARVLRGIRFFSKGRGTGIRRRKGLTSALWGRGETVSVGEA